MEKLEHHISKEEMKQLQYFAHLLWLGDGEKIDLTVIKYKRDKQRKEFTREEKLKMFHLNHVEKVTMEQLSQIFKIHPSSISKFIREIKREKGLPIKAHNKKEK